AEVVVTVKNFAPESLVVLGDKIVSDAVVESATSIRLNVPAQNVAGNRTLSVKTRGGIAQTAFDIVGKPLSELAVGEITTIAGGIPFLGDGGAGTNARLSFPTAGLGDSAGNIFITNRRSKQIRRQEASG